MRQRRSVMLRFGGSGGCLRANSGEVQGGVARRGGGSGGTFDYVVGGVACNNGGRRVLLW